MTNEEIKIASERMEMRIKKRDDLPYMSTLKWVYFDGELLGIETLMYALGYEWNGQEFVNADTIKTKEC